MKHIELLQHQLEYALETVEQQDKRIAELEKKVKELEDTIEDYNNDAYERSELDV